MRWRVAAKTWIKVLRHPDESGSDLLQIAGMAMTL